MRTSSSGAVHPRVCGERVRSRTSRPARCGSSPRVRGTGLDFRRPLGLLRFIPACAGNGLSLSPFSPIPSVHPRVCGERDRDCNHRCNCCGSSPRVRGTVAAPGRARRSRRFIPACAGNGTAPAMRRTSPPVHPRVCGERHTRLHLHPGCGGSSPRVRGTASTQSVPRLQGRFIPACAGNGSLRPTYWPATSVHPRVCGERVSPAAAETIRSGSSPRVRGTGVDGDRMTAVTRFIPACAGNGFDVNVIGLTTSVHPRVCGERGVSAEELVLENGSSPRVRGTADHRPRGVRRRRFIPACAGNGGKGTEEVG